MIFRRTIVSAILVGLLAGLLLSAFQVWTVNPIIFAAESFEIPETHDHEHSDEAWGPSDGTERTAFTVLSNVFAGIGFAAIVLSMMSQLQVQGVTRLSALKGLAWGLAGFIAFFVAPGIGLPPEIPGIEAQPVENRQLWWLFAVISVATGFLLISFAPIKLKGLALIAFIAPYLVAVPHHQGPAFVHPDAYAVETLTQLHQEFIVASGVSNLAFWLFVGLASAWLLNAWVLKDRQSPDTLNASA